MSPHLGSGAGQGIEDAYLLAQLLSHSQTTEANVEVGLFDLQPLLMSYLSLTDIQTNRMFSKLMTMSVDHGLKLSGKLRNVLVVFMRVMARVEVIQRNVVGIWKGCGILFGTEGLMRIYPLH